MGGFAEFCKDEAMGAFLLLLLVPDRQTITIPVEDLHTIAASIDEQEQVTGAIFHVEPNPNVAATTRVSAHPQPPSSP